MVQQNLFVYLRGGAGGWTTTLFSCYQGLGRAVSLLGWGDNIHIQAYIATYRLNWPRGQSSENAKELTH